MSKNQRKEMAKWRKLRELCYTHLNICGCEAIEALAGNQLVITTDGERAGTYFITFLVNDDRVCWVKLREVSPRVQRVELRTRSFAGTRTFLEEMVRYVRGLNDSVLSPPPRLMLVKS